MKEAGIGLDGEGPPREIAELGVELFSGHVTESIKWSNICLIENATNARSTARWLEV